MSELIVAFVGKGGVGKTSIATAMAMNLAEKGSTSLVSTDFMSSLRQVFPGEHENLTIIELKEKDVARDWKEKYGEQVKAVLDEFIDVEDWFLDHIASSPGIAEEFMIAQLVDLKASGQIGNIVWDTAASSSTMHLLYMEKEFYEHLDRDVKILLRLRDRFRSSKVMKILDEWKDLARSVWSELLKVNFYIVSTTDELSLLQSESIREDLISMGMQIRGTIVNRNKAGSAQIQDAVAYIPELEGSASEIVSQIRPYLPLL